jgi:hypothetical protein
MDGENATDGMGRGGADVTETAEAASAVADGEMAGVDKEATGGATVNGSITFMAGHGEHNDGRRTWSPR